MFHVRVHIYCDSCATFGPRILKVGASGEVIPPENWVYADENWFCSVTCRERRHERPEIKVTRRAIYNEENYHSLLCVGKKHLGSSFKVRRFGDRYDPWLLPPGWVEPTNREKERLSSYYYHRVGICPECLELREPEK